MNEEVAKVTIDGNEYAVDALSESAKQQIMNLRVTDQELVRLRQSLAIATTARAAYAQALTSELAKMDATKH